MANEGTNFNTPLGRIVWGHPLVPQYKTDQQTNQPVINDKGEKINQWAFGLAIPKAEIGPLWAAMQAEAAKGFPAGVPGNFSWKLKDCDSIDRKGKRYGEREGYEGCYVLTITTEYGAPGTFVFQNGAYRQLQPNEIKSGDFVTVGLNLKVNVPTKPQHTPGLYVNPLSVLLMFEGDEIKSGFQADPNAIHGAQPQQVAMPAGARPIGSGGPVGTTPPAGASMPGMPGNGPGAVGMPTGPVVPAQPTMSMPGAPSSVPPPVAPVVQPAGPVRPTDPSHVHDNGNGTEQWFVNGAWDGQQHPKATLPPPATDFVTGAPGQMPGLPGPR